MRNKLWLPVLAVFLTLALSLPGAARVSVGTIEGTVVDARGKALVGATVTIETSDGLHPHATRTDANGHFEFARFETGQYDLRAYWHGAYSDWMKRLVIRSQKPTQVSVRIVTPPKP